MNSENKVLAIFLILLIISLFLILTDFLKFKFGLEIAGGTILYYDVDVSKIDRKELESNLQAIKNLIERRINYLGVSEARISYSKKGRITVEIPNIKDPELAKKTIGETPVLEFRIPSIEGTTTIFISSALTGKYLKNASVEIQSSTGLPVVALEFDKEGAKIFSELTEKYQGKPIAIYLDNKLISAPIVKEKITTGRAIIEGNFELKEAKDLANKLNQGALPVSLKLVGSNVINPILGRDILKSGIIGGVCGILLVIFFMLIFYGSQGLVADIALLFYIAFNLFLYKLFSIHLSISGIVGFVLSIGMAVDANILIAERILEEKKTLSLKDAIINGFSRAWTSIRDSNVSTIISCILMYLITTSFVKGFAITLGLGVLISMLTAVYFTKVLTLRFIR